MTADLDDEGRRAVTLLGAARMAGSVLLTRGFVSACGDPFGAETEMAWFRGARPALGLRYRDLVR